MWVWGVGMLAGGGWEGGWVGGKGGGWVVEGWVGRWVSGRDSLE